jgi:hypothetical protein
MHVKEYTIPQFTIVVQYDPPGMKPGRYYYVMYLPFWRKVSRYVRRYETAGYKLERYTARWNKGERHWPEVGRDAELRDSKYAIPSPVETFRQWVSKTLKPSLATYYGTSCGRNSGCKYVPLP